ncbi:MAG: hypothetical protein IJ604_02025 [Prevotella sp.]|nr:hypothetical protein [Prevotella sp.]
MEKRRYIMPEMKVREALVEPLLDISQVGSEDGELDPVIGGGSGPANGKRGIWQWMQDD